MSSDEIRAIVSELSRRDGRRIAAAILRVVGGARLAFAEDCVQDAFTSALEAWPKIGVPLRPLAWVLTAARNNALDKFRQSAVAAALETRVAAWMEALAAPGHVDFADEELTLLVMCCHENLEEEARVALTLKSVCGLSVSEIARAFLVKPETIAQRLTRAKARVRELDLDFAVPAGAALRARMPSVLKAIYLLFNQGYAPGDGEAGVRADICHEALKLARLVSVDARTTSAEAWALRALLCFQHSRTPARLGPSGDLILLPDQERAKWNRVLISEGFDAMSNAMHGDAVTMLHLEAGAASVHAMARNWMATDWSAVIGYYDGMMALAPSPVIAANRALALSMRDGPKAGLIALAPFSERAELRAYPQYHLVLADLRSREGDVEAARHALTHALTLDLSAPERRLIEARLLKLVQGRA